MKWLKRICKAYWKLVTDPETDEEWWDRQW
jgi:hypothetical protein